ncbi:hypothetical protein [Enterovibrio calviensis]|uniref:hypothetical protein n=1 Tax=Enterovibrio calviensis TaxID=91359 RepID=UPI000486A8A9|nr:hypothetical protein [Enterovibrio calviensis]
MTIAIELREEARPYKTVMLGKVQVCFFAPDIQQPYFDEHLENHGFYRISEGEAHTLVKDGAPLTMCNISANVFYRKGE